MKGLNVVLVAPPYIGTYIGTRYRSLGIGYLASFLRSNGYKVDLVDGFLRDLSVNQTLSEILRVDRPLLIGFSLLQYHQYLALIEILPILKKERPDAHITLGNYFPSFWYEELLRELPQVDSVIRFEGEVPLQMLIDRLAQDLPWSDISGLAFRMADGTVCANDTCHPTAPIDELPPPACDDVKSAIQADWPITVHGSRGCSFGACTFCTVPDLYQQTYRSYSAERLLDEVTPLVRDFGATFILFTDDNFLNGGRKAFDRVRAFARGIQERRLAFKFGISCRANDIDADLFAELKAAGLASVFIGIESIVPRTLKLFRKGYSPHIVHRALSILDDLKIKLSPGFIMFEADTTMDEIRQGIDFFRSANVFGTFHLNQLTITRGTEMHRRYQAEGRLRQRGYSFEYDFSDPDVRSLVRMLQKKYIPLTRPYIEPMYRLWFSRLRWDDAAPAAQAFDHVARSMLDYDLDFMTSAMTSIELGQQIEPLLTAATTYFQDLGRQVTELVAYASERQLHA